MKTLSLVPYEIPTDPPRPYPIKDALVNVLFGQAGLRAREVLRRDDIARKILAADDQTLLLEDAEYDQLKAAFEANEGFGRYDVELVRRVFSVV